MQAEDYVTRPRDSVRKREVAKRLRQLPEEERYEFVRTLLDKDYYVALVFATACLRETRYFAALLDHGFKTTPQYIDDWLKCVVPKLGFRKVVYLVMSRLPAEPKGVELAAYHLWRLRPEHDQRAQKLLMKLNALLRKNGLRTSF